ncbi:cell division protein FtsZ [Salinadaptatus halalkaliphilus]|uniref:Tubulin-like protein CetZ n=1 Tax=Salinadaptatus halalkaliphilus TaxID=2419781 RepID=A0A4V3VL76_9EURY|nr:tubulin/FtsZ family protein [Salinadaptatus halalkaliphilus]THE64577.1 cell division protein FtsZ [Salinadaptatus halalkaliphilus]
MKLALIGVGRGGSRVVDRLVDRESATGRTLCDGNALVFDTTETTLEALEFVPEERRSVFGDIHPNVGDDGLEGDPDLGAEVAREDVEEIRRAFDDLAFTDVDAALVVAGLGGGTGGGAGAIVLEELQTMLEKPVYAVGLLPTDDESDRRIHTAMRSLQSFVTIADNVVCFDNESWRSTVTYDEHAATESADDQDGDDTAVDDDRDEDDTSDPYDEIDDAAARHVHSLFGANELESTTLAENRIDASDIARTLETGGVSTIGQATLELERTDGPLPWLPRPSWLPDALARRLQGEIENNQTDAAAIKRLVRSAVESRLTLPCDVASTHRALVVLSGPPAAVSRKGFESARYWLEQETDTVEILAGDEPLTRSSTITATVLLSNVTTVPRIDDLQARAVAAEREREGDDAGTAATPADAGTNEEFIW